MSTDLNQDNKKQVWTFWQRLENSTPGEASPVACSLLSKDHAFHGPDPILDLQGQEGFIDGYWTPLQQSFSGLRRETHLFIGGRSNGRADGQGDGRMWVGGTGVFHGRFKEDWLGIPATGQAVTLRWGETLLVEEGCITETYCLLDVVDLMRQAGCNPLPPARGKDGVWPAPRDDDAVFLEAQDPETSEKTLVLIREFIYEGLNVYDQDDLTSMGLADYFPPDVQWFGPGGIGYCNGMDEFENLHQRHWLHAFPDRTVQDLNNLFAEENYTGAAGWNGVVALHNGQYLDCPPTGRRLGINGLDFWRREGNRFIENWVFVDMIHLFRQMGVDLLKKALNVPQPGPRDGI